jgi:hypoxanthine phosphoribosyltransferase
MTKQNPSGRSYSDLVGTAPIFDRNLAAVESAPTINDANAREKANVERTDQMVIIDDVRDHGRTLTIMCPIIVTFVENNPQYSDLIDSAHPGVMKTARK